MDNIIPSFTTLLLLHIIIILYIALIYLALDTLYYRSSAFATIY